MAAKRTTIPEDVKITHVSWRMLEAAVDRALRPLHPPAAKKAVKRVPAKRRAGGPK